MYEHFGLAGAYLSWTLLFILLGGWVLGSLVSGKWALPKFYLLFGLAFFAYAIGWTAAYFLLRDGLREWVGSLAGSVLLSFVFAAGFGKLSSFLKWSAVLFITNSAGYFLGSWLNNSIQGGAGMLSWGILYGLFLGVGLGMVLHWAQES